MTILANNFGFGNSNNNSSVKNFKHENCPVCNNNDARCKPSHGETILCWNTKASEVDEDQWYVVADIDAGGSGMRGVMVAPRRGTRYEQEDPEILEYKREQARQKRSLELANLPTVETRDRGYREILGAMELSLNHRSKLIKRGLSAEQIRFAERLLWFKTWQSDINSTQNIAGIDPATQATRWLGGMVISAIDQNDKILGGQIAADNISVVGKYFWLSSLKVGGYGCNMPYTNALPLFVRKHPNSYNTSQVWLCEGGLKSALVALKAWETDVNIVVVGTAMSARFSEQLIDILSDLKPSDGVTVFPDAGTVENLSILTGVLMTLDQIKKTGYTPRIGWWQQWKKDECSQDIDDYLMANNGDYSRIELLSVSQFVSLATPEPENIAKKAKQAKTDANNLEPTQSNRLPFEQKAYNNKAYKSYQKYSELTPPDVTKFGNIITSQPKLATDWNALESDGEPVYQTGWEFYPPRPGEILFIGAGTGEGKSHLLAYWMNEYFKESGTIFLGYRNGLLLQQCKKVNGLEHLRDEKSDGFLRLADPYYRVAFCDASLHNMRGGYAYKKILVIDEVMSVINSLLLGATCSRERRKRLDVIREMLREAEMVICLDAHLADWCVDLLTNLSKKDKRMMINKWQGQPRRVKMLMGTDTNPNDKTAIRSDILADAKQGKAIAVFSDSQHELESLNELMIKQGVEANSIARVDSKTSSEKSCIELLSDIDLYLETHPEIKILLVSPSGDSGLDLSRVYFKHVYLILCGTLTINSALQMYGRVRDRNVPRTVFCAKDALFKIDGGFTKSEVNAGMNLSIENQLRLITDGEEDGEELERSIMLAVKKWQERESLDRFSDAVSKLIAKSNFEKLYYRELFTARLKEMGDLIEFVYEAGSTDTKKDFQEVSLSVKYAQAAKLVSADDISEIVAESLRRKELNPDQVMQLKKFDYKKRIPGVELDVDLAKTLLYDRSFLTGLEQRYYLSNPQVSKAMTQLKWSNTLARREFFTYDLRSRLSTRTDCLNKLGLLEFLDDREWLENGSEVKIIRQRWDILRKEYGNELRAIMGFDWDKRNPIKSVVKLLALVGCDLRVAKIKTGQTKKEQKIKKRKITYGSLNDPTRLAILKSFDKRFESLTKVDWLEVQTVCQNELELELELDPENIAVS